MKGSGCQSWEIYNSALSLSTASRRSTLLEQSASACTEKTPRLRSHGAAINQKAYAVLRGAFVSILLSSRNIVHCSHIARDFRCWRTPTRTLAILMIRYPHISDGPWPHQRRGRRRNC
jgi:hypothetical protein